MDAELPLVSIVCAASVEEDALPRFHSALFRVLRPLETSYRFEVIYIGTPRTAPGLAPMQAVAQLDPRVIVTLSAATTEDEARRNGLERAGGSMVVLFDATVHSAEILPQLLEHALGACSLVVGVPTVAPEPGALGRLFGQKPAQEPRPCLLLKRDAIEAVESLGHRDRPIEELALMTTLPRAKIEFTPVVSPSAAGQAPPSKLLVENLAAFLSDSLRVATGAGAMVFFIGVFLLFWFPVQNLLSPGSVWFSWAYLIVLLHLLGGSILYFLGKIGGQLHDMLEERRDETAGSDAMPKILPLSRKNN